MNLWEILVIGAALSADAFAASVSDAVCEKNMSRQKGAFLALTFGLFQFLMPLLGYFCSAAFSSLVEAIAPYLSFALLLLVGGKAVIDWEREGRKTIVMLNREQKKIGVGGVLVQGIATSLDALAVGVALLAQEVAVGLPVHIVLCSSLIGATTLTLSLLAVTLGKAAGKLLEDKAQFFGGAVLVFIGFKILLEGVL